MSQIEKLLQGSIDMHIHHGPDARLERRVDALQAAVQAQQAGMRAIVLKSHDYPTTPVAYTVSQIVKDIIVFGSMTLDQEVGGLNIHAVEASAKLGAKVIWFPTFTSANDMKKTGRNPADGITILDDKGKLLPVVNDILDIIKKYRIVLATGHISVAEAFALVEEARKKGLTKVVATHPLLERIGACLTLDEQRKMVEKGAFMEHCFSITMPLQARLDPMKIVEAIRAVGPEHVVISTDLGQAWNPAPAEGMRMAIATLLKLGVPEKDIELMVKVNPAKLLDLD